MEIVLDQTNVNVAVDGPVQSVINVKSILDVRMAIVVDHMNVSARKDGVDCCAI